MKFQLRTLLFWDELFSKLPFGGLILIYAFCDDSFKGDRAWLKRKEKFCSPTMQRKFMKSVVKRGLCPSSFIPVQLWILQKKTFEYVISCVLLLERILIPRRYLPKYYGNMSDYLYSVSRLPEDRLLHFKMVTLNAKKLALLGKLQSKIQKRKLAPIGCKFAYEDERNAADTELSVQHQPSYMHTSSPTPKFVGMNTSEFPITRSICGSKAKNDSSTGFQGEYRLFDGNFSLLECLNKHVPPKSLPNECSYISKIQNCDHSLYSQDKSPIYRLSENRVNELDSAYSSSCDSLPRHSSSNELASRNSISSDSANDTSTFSDSATDGDSANNTSTFSDSATDGDCTNDVSSFNDSATDGVFVNDVSSFNDSATDGVSVNDVSSFSDYATDDQSSTDDESSTDGDSVNDVSSFNESATDSDSVNDVSSFSDSATEGDSDGDSDSDSATEGDSDSDSATDSTSDTDSEGDPDPDTEGDPDSEDDPDPDTEGDPDSEGDSDTDLTDFTSDSEGDSDTDLTDFTSDSEGDSECDSTTDA